MPDIPGWTTQWYPYAPEPENVSPACPPPAMMPVSNIPRFEVAEWLVPSSFRQQTTKRSGRATVVAVDGE